MAWTPQATIAAKQMTMSVMTVIRKCSEGGTIRLLRAFSR
jgi:hypothetical protein